MPVFILSTQIFSDAILHILEVYFLLPLDNVADTPFRIVGAHPVSANCLPAGESKLKNILIDIVHIMSLEPSIVISVRDCYIPNVIGCDFRHIVKGECGHVGEYDFRALHIENMKRVCDDVEWYTDKFDYRNKDADWKNSKDALIRAIKKLDSIELQL